MLPMFDDLELIYTETDSLVYQIKTDDMFKTMHENKEIFDLSDLDITVQIGKKILISNGYNFGTCMVNNLVIYPYKYFQQIFF